MMQLAISKLTLERIERIAKNLSTRSFRGHRCGVRPVGRCDLFVGKTGGDAKAQPKRIGGAG